MQKLALKGGKPVRTKKFIQWPVFGSAERRNLLKVFDSGKWWYGDWVKKFEEEYAKFHNAKYGVSCMNGTVALEIGLLACGIKAGDEVIVPPYTFVATATAVMKARAIPVFADIDLDTCNMDLEQVKKKLTRKTKAVMPVHFAGLPVDMDAYKTFCKKHKLALIEDACHSWGSQWKGKGTGAIGDCGAFSFQMSKNITAGEGGILLSNNEHIADMARSFHNCGRMKGKAFYDHYNLGSNYRMTELQAAILLGQLTRLKEQTLRRDENGQYLDKKLAGIPGIGLLKRDKRITRRSYHMYIFRFLEDKWEGIKRETFLKAVQAEGIPVVAGYTRPLYENTVFTNRGNGPEYCPTTCPYNGHKPDYTKVFCPNTDTICKHEGCWLTHNMLLGSKKDMDDIVNAIQKVWENRDQLKG